VGEGLVVVALVDVGFPTKSRGVWLRVSRVGIALGSVYIVFRQNSLPHCI
jgi:hypothetical protein